MRLSFLLAFALAGCTTAPKAPAWKAGQDVGTSRATAAAEVTKLAPGTDVVLEGNVTRVCKHRGCWVEIDGVIAKSVEHDVLLPKDCEGRRARVVGVVRHQEVEEGKGDGCPKPRVIVEIRGAALY